CTPQGSGGGTTENGVTGANCCTDLTVIYARGTGESGNVGFVAGPPMFKSLRTKLGANRVTVQGVAYPADSAGNSNLGASGGPAMAASVKLALSQCPSSKIVVSGYSQGSMVAHNAFDKQGLKSAQVSGMILFGDPLISQTTIGDLPASKIKEFCGSTDPVCGKPTGNVTGGHTSYGTVADQAADWVIAAAGLA
ncbi:carbohydrate esterase family 5 protein, partial [Pleomassaria siparia CBS 279.74]